MSAVLSQVVSPRVLFYIFLITTQIAQGFYLASQVEPPPGFTLLYRFAFLWIIGWWLLTDSRKLRVPWVFDTGFFLSVAWPIVIPYYLLKSRGSKGLLVILALVGAYFGANIIGGLLYALLISTAA